MTDLAVVSVPAALTRPLRLRVLRPGQRAEELVFPGDEDVDARHFAVRRGDDPPLAVASLVPERPPWPIAPGPPNQPGWRLRGMATAPEARGQRLGARLLAAVVDHVAGAGGGALWCNARMTAYGFYTRCGFSPYGEVFDIEGIGPHIVMWRDVPPAAPS